MLRERKKERKKNKRRATREERIANVKKRRRKRTTNEGDKKEYQMEWIEGWTTIEDRRRSNIKLGGRKRKKR